MILERTPPRRGPPRETLEATPQQKRGGSSQHAGSQEQFTWEPLECLGSSRKETRLDQPRPHAPTSRSLLDLTTPHKSSDASHSHGHVFSGSPSIGRRQDTVVDLSPINSSTSSSIRRELSSAAPTSQRLETAERTAANKAPSSISSSRLTAVGSQQEPCYPSRARDARTGSHSTESSQHSVLPRETPAHCITSSSKAADAKGEAGNKTALSDDEFERKLLQAMAQEQAGFNPFEDKRKAEMRAESRFSLGPAKAAALFEAENVALQPACGGQAADVGIGMSQWHTAPQVDHHPDPDTTITSHQQMPSVSDRESIYKRHVPQALPSVEQPPAFRNDACNEPSTLRLSVATSKASKFETVQSCRESNEHVKRSPRQGEVRPVVPRVPAPATYPPAMAVSAAAPTLRDSVAEANQRRLAEYRKEAISLQRKVAELQESLAASEAQRRKEDASPTVTQKGEDAVELRRKYEALKGSYLLAKLARDEVVMQHLATVEEKTQQHIALAVVRAELAQERALRERCQSEVDLLSAQLIRATSRAELAEKAASGASRALGVSEVIQHDLQVQLEQERQTKRTIIATASQATPDFPPDESLDSSDDLRLTDRHSTSPQVERPVKAQDASAAMTKSQVHPRAPSPCYDHSDVVGTKPNDGERPAQTEPVRTVPSGKKRGRPPGQATASAQLEDSSDTAMVAAPKKRGRPPGSTNARAKKQTVVPAPPEAASSSQGATARSSPAVLGPTRKGNVSHSQAETSAEAEAGSRPVKQTAVPAKGQTTRQGTRDAYVADLSPSPSLSPQIPVVAVKKKRRLLGNKGSSSSAPASGGLLSEDVEAENLLNPSLQIPLSLSPVKSGGNAGIRDRLTGGSKFGFGRGMSKGRTIGGGLFG
ncbi:unnamed protein product [Parajaminaea phylloscopi]